MIREIAPTHSQAMLAIPQKYLQLCRISSVAHEEDFPPMSQETSQISASTSTETKHRMEQYARQHGVKKGDLVETALQHHLNALETLPQDVIIPPVLQVSRDTEKQIIDRIENPLLETPW